MGDTAINRQQILDMLDKDPQIKNWRASTGAIFIASEVSAKQLSEALHGTFPKLHFIIAPIDIEKTWGYSDKDTWEFIRRPQQPGQRRAGS
jgi:hypothetical protein